MERRMQNRTLQDKVRLQDDKRTDGRRSSPNGKAEKARGEDVDGGGGGVTKSSQCRAPTHVAWARLTADRTEWTLLAEGLIQQ